MVADRFANRMEQALEADEHVSEEIRPVSADTYDQMIEMLGIAYGRIPAEYFRRRQLLDPAYSFEQAHVVVVDGSIASHVQVGHRVMRFGAQGRIPFGYIGDVATHPQFRGRGYATRLLSKSIDYMNQVGMPLSILYTGVQPLYQASGWHVVPACMLRATTPTRLPTIPAGIEVSPFEDASLKDLGRCYEVCTRSLVGPTIRPQAYFDNQMKWLEVLGPVHWDVIWRAGRVAGYVRTRVEKDALVLMDVCAPAGPVARAACAQVINRAAQAERGLITALVTESLPWARELSLFTEIELIPWEAQMLRINNLAGILNCARGELSRRRRMNASPAPPAAVRVGAEAVRLEFPPGAVVVGQVQGDEATLRLTEKEFLGLLLGVAGAQDPIRNSDLMGMARRVLCSVFPESGHVFWRADI